MFDLYQALNVHKSHYVHSMSEMPQMYFSFLSSLFEKDDIIKDMQWVMLKIQREGLDVDDWGLAAVTYLRQGIE